MNNRLSLQTILAWLLPAAVMAVGVTVSPGTGAQEQPATEQAKLDALLQQRHATLQELVEIATVEFKAGVVDFAAVADAARRLIDAQLDVTPDRESRIALLDKQTALLKDLVAVTDARFNVGHSRRSELLNAKAALLDSQIRLARERAAGADE